MQQLFYHRKNFVIIEQNPLLSFVHFETVHPITVCVSFIPGAKTSA